MTFTLPLFSKVAVGREPCSSVFYSSYRQKRAETIIPNQPEQRAPGQSAFAGHSAAIIMPFPDQDAEAETGTYPQPHGWYLSPVSLSQELRLS